MILENKFNISLEQNLFLAKKNIISNIYANARMEGLNVTFSQTQTILEGVNVPNLKIDEIQVILNLRDAWNYVINNVEEKLDLKFICKVNEYVARNESLEWGVLRNGKVSISGTSYIPDIPKIEEVENRINKILEIPSSTDRAIEYMLFGMREQLFWDGNKRTSMIVANKIMIENGAGIIRISDEYLEEFNRLLSDFYTTNEKDKIKEFLFKNCIEGIEF